MKMENLQIRMDLSHQYDRLGLPFIFWLRELEESWKNVTGNNHF
jgi:hypothetical protein